MDVVNPEVRPTPGRDTEVLEAEQRAVARQAQFSTAVDVDPSSVAITTTVPSGEADAVGDGAIVVGVDQAFTDAEAVSAAIAIQSGQIIESVTATAPLELPYIPGLLAYREAPAIVEALTHLAVDPDIILFDGSGRIHFRQAGIATHIGVLFDVPAIGVAKSLLCGRPRDDLDTPHDTGTTIPIAADESVESLEANDADWPVIGAAYQSRQYTTVGTQSINPLYVSPGHRLDVASSVAFVAALCAEYKLPDPIRLADSTVNQAIAED